MKMRWGLLVLFLAAAALFAAQPGWADNDDDDDELEFEVVELFIEYNDTDQDVGIQVMLDGDPWKKVALYSPNGKKMLDIVSRRSVKKQGVSELFFESAEPSLDDVPLSTFLKRFPEGEYEFEGKTIDGEEIEGETEFTHVIPAGPEIVSPVSATDDLPVVDPDDAVIEWEPVTETIDGCTDIEIVRYQVIIVQEDPTRSLLVDLPADATSFTVPSEFFAQKDALHGFEVLAKEESGNQTISAGEFMTKP